MTSPSQAVREIQHIDIEPLSNYWFESSPDFLISMGVDLSKMPTREEWKKMLNEQLDQPYEEKKSYCIIWLLDDEPVGHSNVNRIILVKKLTCIYIFGNRLTGQRAWVYSL
jgi:hypothetical protein